MMLIQISIIDEHHSDPGVMFISDAHSNEHHDINNHHNNKFLIMIYIYIYT